MPPLFFERKTISDLFGTLGKGHERFKREIKRAQDSNVGLVVVIEGSLGEVLLGFGYSTLKGLSVLRQLLTFKWRYGVDHRFFVDRSEMSEYIVETFVCVGKEYLRNKS